MTRHQHPTSDNILSAYQNPGENLTAYCTNCNHTLREHRDIIKHEIGVPCRYEIGYDQQGLISKRCKCVSFIPETAQAAKKRSAKWDRANKGRFPWPK